jgi:hypothetical protein
VISLPVREKHSSKVSDPKLLQSPSYMSARRSCIHQNSAVAVDHQFGIALADRNEDDPWPVLLPRLGQSAFNPQGQRDAQSASKGDYRCEPSPLTIKPEPDR